MNLSPAAERDFSRAVTFNSEVVKFSSFLVNDAMVLP